MTPASSATPRARGRHRGACCGAPGIYRVTAPEAAAALGRLQALAVVGLDAELLVSTDHWCIAQLQRQLRDLGQPLAVHHPIQVLARAIEAGRAPAPAIAQ